ncbi:MAG: response regulator [Anaeromyxobacter sp.]
MTDEAKPGTVQDKPRGRVLVVDDDPLVGSALSRALASQHEVTVMQDAQAALGRLTGGESFDVILCDLLMPAMTGMELHAAIAARAPALAERMVFLTGGAYTDAARAFVEQAGVTCVEKPFELAGLRALVNARVQAARAG